jgi:dihydroxy-acid dehydratase
MAVGGSTNGVLHLQAVAAELDMELPLATFNEISKTIPLMCDIAPSGSGKYLIKDFDEAGGLPAALKAMQKHLASDVITVTGQPLGAILENAAQPDGRVIHSLDNPLSEEGGLIFLQGNLAPGGALIKESAVPAAMHQHRGPARIFPSEEEACEALDKDQLHDGDVVIVRNVGPKGDPGMLLLQRFLWQLAAKGKSDTIAFLTDGRFSGTNKGCAVAHIAPEAAAGGPLAVVKDGDMIEIDIPNERITLDVSQVNLDSRLADWSPPESKVKKGYLSIYAKMANTAEKGAALNYKPE